MSLWTSDLSLDGRYKVGERDKCLIKKAAITGSAPTYNRVDGLCFFQSTVELKTLFARVETMAAVEL